jgi:hypothetical protein
MPSEDLIDAESVFLILCQSKRFMIVMNIIKTISVAPMIPATKSALEEAGPKKR